MTRVMNVVQPPRWRQWAKLTACLSSDEWSPWASFRIATARAFLIIVYAMCAHAKGCLGATTFESSSLPTNGLVGYWPLDENGGATANDTSGKEHHGTIAGVNTPGWAAPGKVGASSLMFNIRSLSNPSRVELPSGLDALATNAGFSISAWCRPNVGPASSGCRTTVLVGQAAGVSTGGNGLGYFYNAGGDFRFNMRFCHTAASNAVVAMSPSHSPVTNWYHVAGVVDRAGGTVKLFMNGIAAATNSFTPGTAPYALWPAYHWQFGAWGGNLDDLNYGRQTLLDEVRMYDRALSDGEVLALVVGDADTRSPTLMVLTPWDLSYTTNNSVSLSGTAADPSGVSSVTVDGAGAGTANGYTNWTGTVGGLAIGTNIVTVQAKDVWQNATSVQVRVVYAVGAFDGNGDSIPDVWQVANFGSLFRADPAAGADEDPDHDGMSNLEEYQTGTDPRDGDDRFAITDVCPAFLGESLTLHWRSASGQAYVVQWSTNLAAWEGTNPPVVADGEVASATDDGARLAEGKFYRVRAIIGQPPAVSIVVPTNGAVFSVPARIVIAVNATDDVSVARVEFREGGNVLGVDATAPYGITWNNVATGTYTLAAIATDSQGLIGMDTVSVIVNVRRGGYTGPEVPELAPVKGDYCQREGMRLPNGRTDITNLITVLRGIGATDFFHLVWGSSYPNAWDDFKLMAPLFQDAGIRLWLYLTPPSEPPAPYPFGADYISWATNCALLSAQYPIVKGLCIDDFTMNGNEMFTPGYCKSMMDAAHEIDPHLALLATVYYGYYNGRIDNHVKQGALDGIVFPYIFPHLNHTETNALMPQIQAYRTWLDAKTAEGGLPGKMPLVVMVYASKFSTAPSAPTPEYVQSCLSIGLQATKQGLADGATTYLLPKANPAFTNAAAAAFATFP